LLAFSGTSAINRENGSFQVTLRDGFKSKDLNKFLFDKGVVASHLVTRKKSLEKQFLEILAES
jgi:ABC-2 type transport system ATP-binding protein